MLTRIHAVNSRVYEEAEALAGVSRDHFRDYIA